MSTCKDEIYHDGNQDQSSIVMIVQRHLIQNPDNFQGKQPDQALYDPVKAWIFVSINMQQRLLKRKRDS